jgi:hypothetical protein
MMKAVDPRIIMKEKKTRKLSTNLLSIKLKRYISHQNSPVPQLEVIKPQAAFSIANRQVTQFDTIK